MRLWKNLRMIHKMFIPPRSIVQRIYHATLTFCILNHIKLSSASAFGASFTFECTKTPQSSTVSCAWRWMCTKMYHAVFFPLLQVTWAELSFIPEHTHTHTHTRTHTHFSPGCGWWQLQGKYFEVSNVSHAHTSSSQHLSSKIATLFDLILRVCVLKYTFV